MATTETGNGAYSQRPEGDGSTSAIATSARSIINHCHSFSPIETMQCGCKSASMPISTGANICLTLSAPFDACAPERFRLWPCHGGDGADDRLDGLDRVPEGLGRGRIHSEASSRHERRRAKGCICRQDLGRAVVLKSARRLRAGTTSILGSQLREAHRQEPTDIYWGSLFRSGDAYFSRQR